MKTTPFRSTTPPPAATKTPPPTLQVDLLPGETLLQLASSSEMVDPFSPIRTIAQMLDLMNHLTDPFFATAATTGGGRQVREDEKNIYLTMEMPGLGKEDVKVYVENDNTLVIRGEVEESSSTKGEGRNYEGRKYYTRLNLPASGYRVDEITGEMKNGVLKVVIPKVTGDEKNRNDVKEVKVE
ncbi:unnamed protein product [Linum tenue]|uniref:SHSP domain-containing protein n=1 Tax=Linum tenue TaxID=586396 RepID=A0AAV0K792_9ROSI|nr:unnamed protein product [Linum tenue]